MVKEVLKILNEEASEFPEVGTALDSDDFELVAFRINSLLINQTINNKNNAINWRGDNEDVVINIETFYTMNTCPKCKDVGDIIMLPPPYDIDSLERYSPAYGFADEIEMEEDNRGEWVRFEDVKKLLNK